MALTDNDKQWIKGAIVEGINGALETVVTPRFDALEKDVSGLKQDVSGLKQDVSGLKKDVSGLKQDVSSLKDEMREVKNRLSGGLNTKCTKLRSDLIGSRASYRLLLMISRRYTMLSMVSQVDLS